MMKKLKLLGIFSLLLLASCNNTEEIYHNVTFLDNDGSVLYSCKVKDGDSAFYLGQEPTRVAPTGKDYYYDFRGWDISLNYIKEDKVVNPLFHIIHEDEMVRGDFVYRRLLEFNDNKTTTIGYELYKYNNLENDGFLEVPDSINNYPILRIGEACFMECALSIIALPESIEVIDSYAFNSCHNLQHVNIPDAAYSIKRAAFYLNDKLETISLNKVGFIREDNFHLCNELKDFEVSEDNDQFTSVNGLLYSKDQKRLIKAGEAKENIALSNKTEIISSESLSRLRKANKVTLPLSVQTIEEKAFFEADVKEVEILGNVTELKNSCFHSCKKLEKVILPSTLEKVDDYAFYRCEKLTDMRLPDKVTSIGNYAFDYCFAIQEFYIPASLESIGYGALDEMKGLKRFTLSSNQKNYAVYDDCLYSKDKKTLVRVPQMKSEVEILEVEKIGSGAFYWCSNLTEINLPSSLKEIEDYAFYYCNQVYNMNIPDSVISIGASAFEGMEGLISIHLPNQLAVLEASLFESCPLLQEVNIPESVQVIKEEVFYNCINLQELIIYDNLQEIGKDAFAACNMLDKIYYTGSEDQWYAIKGLSISALSEDTIITFDYVVE